MAWRLYYCDEYEIPLPLGHKFPIRKYRLLRESLSRDGSFEFVPAPLADPEVIALTHDPDYVRRFLIGTLDPSIVRRIGFPWSEGLVQRTLASVGSTLSASRDALVNGWGGGLAGGTHHAFRSEGAGFCVFNDIAVAITALRAEERIQRVSIVDLDVHQGDGTAAIFESDPQTLTISVHGRNNFPFRKQQSKLDINLEDQTTDEEYLGAIEPVMSKAIEFRPDIVFYQSGVDGLASDRLGRLALTHAGLLARDRRVLSACRAAGVPCVITLGGGYADPIKDTVEAHAATFRTAALVFGDTDLSANLTRPTETS
jgi:acetoin utilization deacetylase AcuC-like enzyme